MSETSIGKPTESQNIGLSTASSNGLDSSSLFKAPPVKPEAAAPVQPTEVTQAAAARTRLQLTRTKVNPIYI